MTAQQVYNIVKYITAKNLQDGYISPEDFNIVINQAQRQYLDYLLGEYQQYRMQRPIPVVGFSQNARIRESLAPLIYGTLLTVAPYGIAGFPSDFEYVDNMWGLYGHYNIRFAQQDRLDSYIHSDIDPIDENPIYLIQHEGFHFFPEDIGQARMSYVRVAPPIIYGYQIDSRGVIGYDPSTSQDPIWSETDIYNIIVRALQQIGVNLQFQGVVQYAQEIKNNGQ